LPLYTVAFGPVGDAQGATLPSRTCLTSTPSSKNSFPCGARCNRGWTNKDVPVELIVENSAGEETLGP
jgi:hypothetical protein